MKTSFSSKKPSLSMEAVIGFSGSVNNSLHMHQQSSSLIYALGSTLCVRELESQTQSFLQGHEKPITIINMSRSGDLIASADKQKSGFLSTILLWDWKTKKVRHRLSMHKEEVRALCFSEDDKYLASVGGPEDKSRVIIWCTETGKALYGKPLKGDKEVKGIQFFRNDNSRLGLVSHSTIELLRIDCHARKIESSKCNISNLKRNFLCMAIDADDEFLYAGTQTGDILEIQLANGIFKRVAPVKNLFGNGVRLIRVMPNGDLLVASGSGTIARIDIQRLKIQNSSELEGSITGLALARQETSFFCGTSRGNIYFGNAFDLRMHLKASCHFSKVNAVVFPHEYAEVFATCGKEQVRIWSVESKKELLRMSVPHVECYDIDFSHDGKTVLSAWSDGKIRAFLPQSGKLLYEILDAHVGGVTALKGTLESKRVVSGGMDGTIRVWSSGARKQSLLRSMKEHRGRVWSIRINPNNKEALSCSADGSCIIWDIENYYRILCIFDKIVFKSIVYHPECAQLLTTGSDRRIGYWEVFDGQLLRSLETCDKEQGEISSLSMMKNGQHFLSGGSDGVVKIWDYDLGETVSENEGHSGGVVALTVSPSEDRVVSVGGEGSVIVWKINGK